MRSAMTAPMTEPMMPLGRIRNTPPKTRSARKPPTNDPMMPSRTVPQKPIGSRPGTMARARKPAMMPMKKNHRSSASIRHSFRFRLARLKDVYPVGPASRDQARPGSPPAALEGPAGSFRAVEGVELGQVMLGQREVEDLGVLGDALPVGRFRDDREPALDRPAQQHLGRRAPEGLRDPADRGVTQVAASPEGAVGLQRDPLAFAGLEEGQAVLEGAVLDL